MTIDRLPSGSYRIRQMFKGQVYSVVVDRKPTQKEAIELMADRLQSSVFSETFEDYARKYIEAKSNLLSPSTLYNYERMLKYPSDKFRKMRLDRITPETVQVEINNYAITHSPKSTRNLHGFISAVLGMYRPNMALRTTLPNKVKDTSYMPTSQEVSQILNAIQGDKMEIPLWLSALGLRRSEIMAVTYKDLSADNMLTISKAMVISRDGKLQEKSTKTTAGTRTIPVPKKIADLMRKTEYTYTGYQGNILRTLNRYQDLLGIPRFKLHNMRHHFASASLKFFNDGDAKNLGGWSSESFMKNVYVYSLTDRKEIQENMEKLYRYLTGFSENDVEI